MVMSRSRTRGVSVLLSVIVMYCGAVACEGQCEARRKFGPYHPAPGVAPTLTNPLGTPGSKAVLKIVTMGDSVVWGNGNVPKNKFSIKVAQHIADDTGRDVLVVAYAHSGARLKEYSYDSLVPVVDGASQQDLNSQRPTTTEQAVCAAGKDKDAEIVLLDGCINEVGATDIALPFPLNWTNEKEIRQRAYTGCSKPMRDLLGDVSQDFPNATVLVLNYYQIVTSDSKLLKAPVPGAPVETVHNGSSTAAVSELQQEREKLLSMSPEGRKQLEQKNYALGLQSWQQNSKAFLDTSMGCFTWAVAAVNGQKVPDLPAVPPANLACPAAVLPPPQRAVPAVRVFLVTLENKPEFGYGALGTHEWRLPVPPIGSRIDDMYAIRAQLCEKLYPQGGADQEECKINAMAHPNVAGAQEYTEQINSVLDKAWSLSR